MFLVVCSISNRWLSLLTTSNTQQEEEEEDRDCCYLTEQPAGGDGRDGMGWEHMSQLLFPSFFPSPILRGQES